MREEPDRGSPKRHNKGKGERARGKSAGRIKGETHTKEEQEENVKKREKKRASERRRRE